MPPESDSAASTHASGMDPPASQGIGALDVLHLQRRPIAGYHSVERLFEDVRAELQGSDITIRLQVNRHTSRGVWPRLADAWAARRARACVKHVTGDVHYLCWGLQPRNTILTVLDCVGLSRMHGLRRALFRQLWYRWPLRHAGWITVISDFTRRELVAETGCDAARIEVIHPHLSAEFTRVDRPFRQGRPRLLQVGSTANKNLEGLAAALSGLDVELVIVGSPDAAQRQALADAGVHWSCRSGLSREELLREYVEADLVVFASLYEGFGLPIIEGQAVGRAVLTADRCSMPEVAGDAACLVDPLDPLAIRAGISRLIADAGYREALVARGHANVQRFALRRIAGQYAALYRRVAHSLRAEAA